MTLGPGVLYRRWPQGYGPAVLSGLRSGANPAGRLEPRTAAFTFSPSSRLSALYDSSWPRLCKNFPTASLATR